MSIVEKDPTLISPLETEPELEHATGILKSMTDLDDEQDCGTLGASYRAALGHNRFLERFNGKHSVIDKTEDREATETAIQSFIMYRGELAPLGYSIGFEVEHKLHALKNEDEEALTILGLSSTDEVELWPTIFNRDGKDNGLLAGLLDWFEAPDWETMIAALNDRYEGAVVAEAEVIEADDITQLSEDERNIMNSQMWSVPLVRVNFTRV